MEWLACIRKVISFIEAHLQEGISVQDAADAVHVSPFFLQRGFSVMTGMGVGEYIRSRRLYEAALDLQRTDDKVIDIALRSGYDTPESFAKAFARFHGSSPMQVRNAGAPIHVFLPMRINVQLYGGNEMNCRIRKLFSMKVIGFQKVFENETAYAKIPEFWDEVIAKYAENIYAGGPPANAYEKAVADNGIGEYGICIDDLGDGKFRYLIAGRYAGGEVPEGMVTYEVPGGDWAVFECCGPLPQALQSVNTRIWREWLPGNEEYELAGNVNIEWYDSTGKTTDEDYHSAIWVPVRKKA